MTCRLCQNEEDLSDSHIIPEFFFKPLYTSKHQFFALSTDEGIANKILQKGLREKLLCQKCETFLSKYELYVAEVFQGTSRLQMKQLSEKRIVLAVDYVKFKLFELSVLWRASISSLDFFSAIVLGDEEEKLRKMLLAEDPGEPGMYGSFLIVPLFGSRIPLVDMIASPDCTTLNREKVYSFVMGGCLWFVNGSEYGVSQPHKKFFLQRDGKLSMMFEDAEKIPMLSNFLQRLATSGKTGKALSYIQKKGS